MVINRMDSLYRAKRICMSGAVAYPIHGHTFAEVFWVDEGEMVHRVNEREVVLRQGDCVLIRPRDVHSLHGKDPRQRFRIVNVAFQWHLYVTLRMRYFKNSASVYAEGSALPRVIRLGKSQLQRMRQEWLLLLRSPHHHFFIERFLMNLLGEYCDLSAECGWLDKSAPLWLQDAWHAFQNPEHFRYGASEFYHLCGRSAEHVSREFHRYAGQTIQERAQQLKLRHAASLLAGTNCDIVDVALECGFESLSHFYACFKKQYQLTPRSYRLSAQSRLYDKPEAILGAT